MTTHDMLVELLAIKLFEHEPLGNGEPHRLSWSRADQDDRLLFRDLVRQAKTAEDLYKAF